MEKLIEIAKKILAANPDAYLSGSLALKLQGHPNPTEPEDIDIWLPGRIKLIEGMTAYSSSDRYEEKSHARESYMIDDVQVDFFYPVEYPEWHPLTAYEESMRLVAAEEILKFKVEHALDTDYMEGVRKHSADIIYILQNHLENTKDLKDTNRSFDLDMEF